MTIEINYLVPTTIYAEVDDEFEKLKTEDDYELQTELRQIALREMELAGDGCCDLESINTEDGETLYEE